jgi:hypothetical protein
VANLVVGDGPADCLGLDVVDNVCLLDGDWVGLATGVGDSWSEDLVVGGKVGSVVAWFEGVCDGSLMDVTAGSFVASIVGFNVDAARGEGILLGAELG